MRYRICAAVALCGSFPMAAAARGAIWDEAVQGDLSGNRQAPSLLVLTPGTNTVTATTTSSAPGPADYEYLRLDVPAGEQIQSMVVRSYTGGGAGATYMVLQRGTTFTQPPADALRYDLLGHVRFSHVHQNIGIDLLPSMGKFPTASGFTPPLPDGSYTLFIETAGDTPTYQLDVIVTPEPNGVAAVAAAGGLALLRRRR